MSLIPAFLPRRDTDAWGSGAFRASRGRRTHKGVDELTYPGTRIGSPVEGLVTKLGYPYGDDPSFRYVEVKDSRQLRHRLFYIEPTVQKGAYVQRGETIGISQNISGRYRDASKPPMPNHVHYEILAEDGTPIDPDTV